MMKSGGSYTRKSIHWDIFCAQLANFTAPDATKTVLTHGPKSFHVDSCVLTCLLDTLIKCSNITYRMF